MPLSNSQYDEIFRKYDEKQLASQHQLQIIRSKPVLLQQLLLLPAVVRELFAERGQSGLISV